MRGQISFQKGNIRIQITTGTKIYFYIINKKTFIPELENVMFNYMKCSQLAFGSRVRFAVSYKSMQIGLVIYTRKFFHNFKVSINNENMENSLGINLKKERSYFMANELDVKLCEC
jgi:hypothetical protein